MRAIVFPPSGMYVMRCAYLLACWERVFITKMSPRTLHKDTGIPTVGEERELEGLHTRANAVGVSFRALDLLAQPGFPCAVTQAMRAGCLA
jgi:hypothetical protein